MKRIMSCIVLILFLSGCSNSNKVFSYKFASTSGEVGVIETSTANKESYLKVYDVNGKKVGEEVISCNDINSGFLSPVKYKDKAYSNSIGGYSNRSNKVVEFDIGNNKFETYEIEYGIFSVESSDDFIFTTSSPPEGSIITKYNKVKKVIEGKVNIEGLAHHINLLNGSLYAFSDSDKRDGSTIITVINPNTLEVEKTIKNKAGLSIFDSFYLDGFIYFTYKMNSEDTAPSKLISKLDINKDIITNIELDGVNPNQIKQYNNSLLINHYNLQNDEGNKLTIFDLKTNEKKLISFEHNLRQIEVKDNYLYCFDGDAIYVYTIDDFKLANKIDINGTRANYRNQGFFLIS